MALVSRWTTGLGVLATVLLLAGPAAAEATTAQKATAEAYFDDGLRLMRQGSFSEACAKLEASQRLDAAVGTLLYLGECYEKLGRTASAWVTFRDAEALARSAAQPQRADMARVHAERLQAGLSRITVELSSEARAIAGLEVRCNSIPIDPALAGAPVPVDPGEVIVEAWAPGYAKFRQTVSVPSGGKLTVSVPALERSAASERPMAKTEAGAPLPEAASSSAPQQDSPMSTRTPTPAAEPTQSLALPIVLASVGVAGLAVGSVFGVKALHNASDANDLCPERACIEQRGESLMNTARHQAQISNIAFAVGGAGLVAAVVVYVLDRPKRPEQALLISPWLSSGQGGIALGGRL